MLDKINFTDIYKFLASIGLFLIITAILLPLFLFQFNIAGNYNINKNLSSSIIRSIEHQENLVYFIMQYWWIPSSLSFLSGIFIFGHGIKQWSKRQSVLDKIQDLDLQQKEDSIKRASNLEVNKKLDEDIDEIGEDLSKKSSYQSMENKVVKAITINNPNIKIIHNAKVNKFVYDIIIIERLRIKQRVHKVCEIKYYQKEIFYSYLKHGVSSFLLAISNYEKYIAGDDHRITVEYYLIWICANTHQKKRLTAYMSKLKNYSKEKGVNLKIVLKLDSELNDIKKEILIFNNRGKNGEWLSKD